ncbi:MAG TPA: hypothetical protein VD993_00585 [Chitinophagaceae bacterium]|nr:hypothetical protein [Chitinophagaceae bacterium]
MRLICIAMIFVLSLPAMSQPLQPLESNRKGVEILRKSLKAYGGQGAIDSMRLAFKMHNSRNISRGQSLAAHRPFEPYFAYYDFMIDRPRGIEWEARKSSIAGFVFENNIIYKNGKAINYDPLLKQYSEFNGNSIANSMTYLPHNIIITALRAPLSVRYIGDQLLGKDDVYCITYSTGNNLDNVFIDKKTHYIVKLQRMSAGTAGEELNEFFFKNHRKVGRLAIPESTDVVRHSSVYGSITNNYAFFDFAPDFTIDTSWLRAPSDYKLADYSYRKNFEVRQLAKDIYLLENITNSRGQWSYNVLFVVMDEYVLVAEAPLNSATTDRVLAKIKEVAPDKPVKYLVQSHHHDDHLGGIRSYIAEGTTIITTANNVDLIQKMAKVSFNAFPDRLAQNPKAPVIETIRNKKHVIKDQNHEVVIRYWSQPTRQ